MIPSGVEVYVASTPVDFRKGPVSLMALVRDGGVDPFNGALYVFRSKRADRVKIIWWDGGGICLFAKTLENGQFCWPRIAPATVRLNYAQFLTGWTGKRFDRRRCSVRDRLARKSCDILNRGIWNASKIGGDHALIPGDDADRCRASDDVDMLKRWLRPRLSS